MKTTKLIISIIILIYVTNATGQVAINMTGLSPDNSAMLDIKSNTLGLLIPRMLSSQRNSILSPATGLIVYVTDQQKFSYYNGFDWEYIYPNGDSDWVINGDTLYNNTASNVAIGIDSPEPSAVFHLETALNYDKGFLVKGTHSEPMSSFPDLGGGARMMFYPGNASFRAGFVSDTAWNDNYVGDMSVAMGRNTIASGVYSTALGYHNEANAMISTAMGGETKASGWYSFSAGFHTEAAGITSTAFGDYTSADASNVFAIGRYNIGGGNATSWTEADPLFEVGNGTYSTRANALTILKNGNTGIGTHQPGYLLEVDGDVGFGGALYDNSSSSGTNGQILVSSGLGFDWKDGSDIDVDWIENGIILYNNTAIQIGIGTDTPEYGTRLHVNCGMGEETLGFLVSGTYVSNYGVPNLGAGSRLSFFPGRGAFRAGQVTGNQWHSALTGITSVAMGYNTIASGAYSTAFGYESTASGTNATAIGASCEASGFFAFAAGESDTASATSSTAFGSDTKASGIYSTSFGQNTRAESSHSFVLGKYNIGGGNASSWVAEDPLFEIGNGTSYTPSNVFTILKNGNTGLGTHEPDHTLEVIGDVEISGMLIDNKGQEGDSCQILKSTGIGFEWVDASTIDNGKWIVSRDTLYNDYAKYVAIGTSSPEPTAQLYVNIKDLSNRRHHGFIVNGIDTATAPFPSLGSGSRLMFYPGKSAFRAGAVDSARWDGYYVGRYSGAIGKDITASGQYSFATGHGGVASGTGAFSAGSFAVASGVASSALGCWSHADGYASFAANYNTDAVGDYSTALGYFTDAESYSSVAIGCRNIGGGTTDSWVATDPLFEIGIAPTGVTANALTVLKNGNTGIGTHQPVYLLEVAGEIGIDSKITHRGDVNTYYEMGNDEFRLVAGNTSMVYGYESSQDVLELGSSGSDIDILLNDQVYLIGSSGRVGIGTESPNENLEIANSTTRGRVAISDAGGSTRYAMLLEAPNSSDTIARIECYHYGTGGVGLEINTTGDGTTIFGGDVIPESHKVENLGADGQAWDNVYCDDVVNQGAAAFTDRNVSTEILLYPPKAKTPEMFDAVTGKGLQELDPNSLPPDLREGRSLLTDEIATYNYKANYEQQIQIQALMENVKDLENIILELTKQRNTNK